MYYNITQFTTYSGVSVPAQQQHAYDCACEIHLSLCVCLCVYAKPRISYSISLKTWFQRYLPNAQNENFRQDKIIITIFITSACVCVSVSLSLSRMECAECWRWHAAQNTPHYSNKSWNFITITGTPIPKRIVLTASSQTTRVIIQLNEKTDLRRRVVAHEK